MKVENSVRTYIPNVKKAITTTWLCYKTTVEIMTKQNITHVKKAITRHLTLLHPQQRSKWWRRKKYMFECLKNPMYLLMQLNCSKNEIKYRALEHYISIALSTYSFHLSSKRPVMTASSSRERGTLSSTLPSAFSILSFYILISTAVATLVSQESLSSKSQFTFHGVDFLIVSKVLLGVLTSFIGNLFVDPLVHGLAWVIGVSNE